MTRFHSFRLLPGQDLFDEIQQFVVARDIRAGVVLSAVGSLTHATLRLANHSSYSEFIGPFEIVAMTGTVSVHGSHLHIAISDGEGKTIGGHLVSGCAIYTTAEIVIAELMDVVYYREPCPLSGYNELVVKPR
ncbi:MAG: DNA-binding protein [Anaerolineales bacterium]|nr:DNA-binding protein [Anaerolineales bacterium]MDW8448192.1 DNA-binding protein [Anaerolineales bacterium]